MKKIKIKRKATKELPVDIIIRVGNTDYDVTGKSPEDFPIEVKAALVPAQKLYANKIIDSNWRQFLETMPPDIKAMYDAASLGEQVAVFKSWAKYIRRNEFGMRNSFPLKS